MVALVVFVVIVSPEAASACRSMKCLYPRVVPNSKGLKVDCGKCLPCRINRTRQWTLRLRHEMQTSKTCVFLTLTYDEQNLPEGGNVSKDDLQNFISDLRAICGPGLRYFFCSEYGETESATNRPHYHGLVFNAPDYLWIEPCSGASRIEKRSGKSGYISFVNTYYNDIWRKGFVTVGTPCPQRIGYLAGYYVSKGRVPEGHQSNFSLMSRRPGIGSVFATRMVEQFSRRPATTSHTGRPVAIPRYYRGIITRETGLVGFDPNDSLAVQEANESKINYAQADDYLGNLEKHVSFKRLYQKQI